MDEKDPKYLLGQQRELERLKKQHEWQQKCYKGRIVFAPLDLKKPDLHVLDMGCADGVLLRDLQKQVQPTAQLLGRDVMPAFLPKDEGNIKYATGDVNKSPPAEDVGAFDFTHVRYVIAGGSKVPLDEAIANLAETVKPGGWLQVQEMDMSHDLEPQAQSINDMHAIMRGVFDKNGLGTESPRQLGSAMEKAGLRDVVVESHRVPVGKLMGNDDDAVSSLIPFELTIPKLVRAVSHLQLDLQPAVTDNLEERFHREMLETGGYFTCVIAYGRKGE